MAQLAARSVPLSLLDEPLELLDPDDVDALSELDELDVSDELEDVLPSPVEGELLVELGLLA